MKTITDIAKMQEFSRQVSAAGLSVGFVPTMGFLHEGHLSLVRHAREKADVVVVSIFVNPTQFNNAEDFEKYPRNDERDRALLEQERVDVLFMPNAGDVYLPGASTTVSVGGLGETLCGPGRPGHFDGVATVVTSLFNMVMPDFAVFGEKDYQQLQIIRRMTRDLHLPVVIDSLPTAREQDGLAMSSRNARLSEEQREIAHTVFWALAAATRAFQEGETSVAALKRVAEAELKKEHEFEIEYLEVVDDESLAHVEQAAPTSVMAVAAWLGGVRLIDNVVLGRVVDEEAFGSAATDYAAGLSTERFEVDWGA